MSRSPRVHLLDDAPCLPAAVRDRLRLVDGGQPQALALCGQPQTARINPDTTTRDLALVTCLRCAAKARRLIRGVGPAEEVPRG